MKSAVSWTALVMAAVLAGACGNPVSVAPASTTSSTSIPSTTTSDPATTPEPTTSTTTAVASAYTFACWGPDEANPVKIQATTLDEVWTQKLKTCEITMDPSHQATAVETKAVKEYHLFNASETTQGALETMIGICAETASDADEISRWSSHVLRGALMLCPKAPRAAEMAAKTSGKTFEDGNWAVGIDVMPGTYRTAAGVRNCYWERTTKGGGTIANDFVSYAVEGVTVTINSTDGGFTSKNCGTWTRVN